jgi:small GTP-binding protein
MAEIMKKIVMMGDPSVGKTSLVRRYVSGKYDDKYISTLGTVVSKKTVQKPKSGNSMTMMIWDISGQPEFKRIHASAFKNASAGLAVCDITRDDTCTHVQEWVSSFREVAGDNAPVTVLANKCDLTEDNKGQLIRLNSLMRDLGGQVYLTSAKTGENVEEVFKELADDISTTKVEVQSTDDEPQDYPPSFDDPSDFLDYMIMRFCEALGDHDMGMHMVRKQVTDSGINFKSATKEEVKSLIEPLVTKISHFKGNEVARKLRTDLMKASNRCNGC